jgi:hypothetical protein
MIGTTRSRVSFFMNRFRKLGFISYNGRIRVNKSLLNVVLLDQFPSQNSQKPAIPTIGSIFKPVIPMVATVLKPVIPIIGKIKRKLSPREDLMGA